MKTLFTDNIFGRRRKNVNEQEKAHYEPQQTPNSKSRWRKAWDKFKEIIDEVVPIINKILSTVSPLLGAYIMYSRAKATHQRQSYAY